MLNKNNERELAYVVRINDIKPIQGSDNCECAVVNGWNVMVRKNTLKPGDLAVYFEIDSKLDITKPEFAFLISKKGHIKTQKYTFGGKGSFLSQGLLMPFSDFGWEDDKYEEGTFLTKELGITYYEPEDNARKSNAGVDKYKKMAQRNGKLFSKQPFRWLMKRSWGRKMLFVFFGKKRDKRGWPSWVKRTDEERIENMPYILENKDPWIASEKLDGSSTTFTIKRKLFGRYDFYVCSRNVVFDKPDKKCFYDTNIYLEMAEKYCIEKKMAKMLKMFPKAEWITLQGETYGGNIQKRDYSTNEHRFAGFNFITSNEGRWNSVRAAKFMNEFNIPWVPILNENYVLPDTIEDLRVYVHSEPSTVDGIIKEGIVFRSQNGSMSFKCVDPEYLIKYHQ